MSEFKLGCLFTDNCVFQRDKEISIFGTGEDGSEVMVSLGNACESTIVSKGRWRVLLPKMEAKNNLTLTCKSGEKVYECKNVAIGEVWLAGGQSNMEFELHNAKGGMTHLRNDHPNVRFFYTPKDSFECPERDFHYDIACWQEFSRDNASNWSAVGYLFAKELSEKLDVTVGVVGCNWGGTSASSWVAKEDLLNGWGPVRDYWLSYEAENEGKSLEEQKKEYLDYLKFRSEWEPECEALYKENPNIEWDEVVARIGDGNYPGPVNAFSPQRPCGLYELMLKEVIKYTYAGVIFYQGESDDHKPQAYYNLFESLIKRWRIDNGDKDLPFIAVQLPMHRFKQDPDFKNWPVIRCNQRRVVKNKKHAYLAVALDCGEYNNIHPVDKNVVAHRLFLQAYCYVYGRISEAAANGPRVSNVRMGKGYVDVTFDFAKDGFVAGNPIEGFEIAPCRWEYKDEDFVPAKAEILENGKIRLTAPGVDKPGHARYLYTNWGKVTLFGKNGIPVEPF